MVFICSASGRACGIWLARKSSPALVFGQLCSIGVGLFWYPVCAGVYFEKGSLMGRILFFLGLALVAWILFKSWQRKQLVEKPRSEEHTSELQSLMRISYAVFCLKTNKRTNKM